MISAQELKRRTVNTHITYNLITISYSLGCLAHFELE